MARIEKRKHGNGFSYRVVIRRKGVEIYKSFPEEEDAKIYASYKEKLIDNMANFEVPLKDRVTLRQILEMKLNEMKEHDGRSIADMELAFSRVIDRAPKNKMFVNQMNYQEWLSIAKDIYETPVHRGVKGEHTKRKMSPISLRRLFASLSSAMSYAQGCGIELDNHPLKVVQSYINPMIKK